MCPYRHLVTQWFKKSIQKPQVWELSRLCPETSTKLYIHEFGFCTINYFCTDLEAGDIDTRAGSLIQLQLVLDQLTGTPERSQIPYPQLVLLQLTTNRSLVFTTASISLSTKWTCWSSYWMTTRAQDRSPIASFVLVLGCWQKIRNNSKISVSHFSPFTFECSQFFLLGRRPQGITYILIHLTFEMRRWWRWTKWVTSCAHCPVSFLIFSIFNTNFFCQVFWHNFSHLIKMKHVQSGQVLYI